MIAIIYPQFYGIGGIARYLEAFLSNLPDEHPKIYLITSDEYMVERHYPNVELIHLPYSQSRLSMLIWSWRARRLVKQLYAQNKIQIVNLHIPPFIPWFGIPGYIPYVLTAHTTYLGMSGKFYKGQYFSSQWGMLETRLKMMLEKLIFRSAKRIIALTNQGMQELHQYHIKTPISVIPNGVDTQTFATGHYRKEIDVLFCGRIERRKGSDAIVALCKVLVALNPDIRIAIVGYGEDEGLMRDDLAAYAKNVHMYGKVDFFQTKIFYQKSKMYVSTSYYEGLPSTCLEAMACGLPAIVWDFAFYHTLVKNGVNGYLIEPAQVDLMATRIIEVLEDVALLEQLGLRARGHVEQHYQWKHLAISVVELLKEKPNTKPEKTIPVFTEMKS